MKYAHRIDFTTGSIPRHLLVFIVPLLLGNLLQTFYSTVDSIWVGRFLGPGALAAVAVSFPVLFIVVSFVIGLAIATNIMIAQYQGAHQEEEARKTVGNSLMIMVVLGIGLTFLGLAFHQDLLRLINTPEEIFPAASSYLLIIFTGLVPLFVFNGVSSVMRGFGDSRTPLLLLGWSTVINVVLDPLMILGIGPFPRMEVAGAALATVIAQGFSGVYGLYLLHRQRTIHFHKDALRFQPDIVRLIFRLGLPAGIQQVGVSIGVLVLMALVNSFGKTVVAAFGAAQRIDQLSFLPAFSFGLAVSPLAGQNLGAHLFERSREVLRWSSLLGAGFSLIVSLVVFLLADRLIRIFIFDPAVVVIGVDYLRIVAFSYVPFSLLFVFSGFIRGAGDAVASTVLTLLAFVFIRLPLAYLLASQSSLRAQGIWIAMAISPVIGLLISIIYYQRGNWKTKILTDPKKAFGQPFPQE